MNCFAKVPTLLVALILAGASASVWAQGDPTKPNVVLILMDNLGYGELGSYGGGVLRGAPTPQIDQLAQEGLRLTNFNVETQCTPSRAAIMTGRYAIRTGNASVPVHTPLYGLVQWEITLAELLSDLGYATGMFGKWHLGQTEGRFPTDQGFDEWYGIPNSTDESWWPGSADFDRNIGDLIQPTYIMQAKKGESPERVKLYDKSARAEIENELVEHTVDFIKRSVNSGKPFFAYVPFTQMHTPIIPNPEFVGKTGNGTIADVLAEMDHNVGRILQALDQLEASENTIVIFAGDNGAESNDGFPGPFRAALFTPYEGGLRTPFIIRWPGKVPVGRVSNEIVHGIDIFPTVASMVGGEVPSDRIIDGVDQTTFFFGETENSAREGFVIYMGKDIVGAKWRNWKVLTKGVENAFSNNPEDALLREYTVPRIFNLLSDPREQRNINITTTWVRWPVSKMILEHMESLQKQPPIIPGTADPYTP